MSKIVIALGGNALQSKNSAPTAEGQLEVVKNTCERIVEIEAIKNLWDSSIVISCGGGGIPVVERMNGTLEGVAAVIDKDFAAELLAEQVDADTLMILTEVEKVAVNWGKPDQKNLDHMSLAEAAQYVEEGQFAPGSMLPKVEAAMKFARTYPNKIGRAHV